MLLFYLILSAVEVSCYQFIIKMNLKVLVKSMRYFVVVEMM